MKCPHCQAEPPLQARFCAQCGAPLRQLPPAFAQAEARYAALWDRYRAGRLDDQTYQQELSQLTVQDSLGRSWLPGQPSGAWRWYDGRQWISGEPPATPAAAECFECGVELAPAGTACRQCGAAAPQLPEALAAAQERYQALQAQRQAGQLDEATYQAQLGQLVVQDEAGRYWAPGDPVGTWRWYDDQAWVVREPPLVSPPDRCRRCGAGLALTDAFCGACGTPRQRLPAEFVAVERRYAALRARYQAGEIDAAELARQLQDLVVQDSQGGYWAPEPQTGDWLWHDGQQWVRRDPPGRGERDEPR